MKFKSLALITVLSLALGLTGCGSKAKKADEAAPAVAAAPTELADTNVTMDSDSGNAGALKSVFFDFNSSQLRADTKSALEGNAAYMKSNAAVNVQVEGHCDERGSVQYNLALGEQRAKAVRNFLVGQGIEGNRISTISFGKERPIAMGHDEESWGKNRRANFAVTAK